MGDLQLEPVDVFAPVCSGAFRLHATTRDALCICVAAPEFRVGPWWEGAGALLELWEGCVVLTGREGEARPTARSGCHQRAPTPIWGCGAAAAQAVSGHGGAGQRPPAS